MTERPRPNSERPTSNVSEFWEERYLEGDTPWDKGCAAPPLLNYLAEHVISGSVCVPGCGLGHDVRALAGQGASVTGMDISPSALKQAESYPKQNEERYVEVDFFDLPQQFQQRFDYIFEHTCFCAIDPARRGDYVESCIRALKPCGQLLAVFFMNPDTEPGEGPPFGTDEAELDDLFSPHFNVLADMVPTIAYAGREGRERLRLLQRRAE